VDNDSWLLSGVILVAEDIATRKGYEARITTRNKN